ncbi:hypothetical protein E0K83_16645 [Gramella sp. BOM4]|nr:hypothetical protein [Christiangramia bathymodioli]
MKEAFRQLSSLMLALLVMFSTMSFTVEKHFCGEHLVDKAVFSEVKTCGMQMNAMTDGHCCSNEQTSVEGQDELKISFDSFDFHQQVFLSTFAYSYFNLFEPSPQQVIPFKDYSPPLLVYDIQLQDQVFLI